MRVVEGDVIGTKDGRYGKIIFLDSQESFVVKGTYLDDDPVVWVDSIDNVASIR